MRNCHPVWLALSVMLAAAAAGEQPAPEAVVQKVALNIDSQPVGDALNELGRQTGLVIIVYSSAGHGVTTPRLTGKFTPEKALDQILANTGLRYEYLDARTVAVLSSQTAVTPSLIARDGHPTKVVPKERGGPPSTASVHTQNESATPTQRPPPRERTAPRENRGDRGTQKDPAQSAVETSPQ